jgi:multidrug resistance efflux pump
MVFRTARARPWIGRRNNLKIFVDVTNFGQKWNLNMSFNPFANKADLEAAQSKIATLEADLETSQNELQAAQAEVTAHAETIAGLQLQLTEISAQLELANDELSASKEKIEESEAKIIEAEASAEAKAVALVAQSGAETPIAIEGNVPLSLREQYNKLTNPSERAAFRNKHWDALMNQPNI